MRALSINYNQICLGCLSLMARLYVFILLHAINSIKLNLSYYYHKIIMMILFNLIHFRPPIDMTGSPLLPPDRPKKPKPKLDKYAVIKKKCYAALLRDTLFNNRWKVYSTYTHNFILTHSVLILTLSSWHLNKKKLVTSMNIYVYDE